MTMNCDTQCYNKNTGNVNRTKLVFKDSTACGMQNWRWSTLTDAGKVFTCLGFFGWGFGVCIPCMRCCHHTVKVNGETYIAQNVEVYTFSGKYGPVTMIR